MTPPLSGKSSSRNGCFPATRLQRDESGDNYHETHCLHQADDMVGETVENDHEHGHAHVGKEVEGAEPGAGSHEDEESEYTVHDALLFTLCVFLYI